MTLTLHHETSESETDTHFFFMGASGGLSQWAKSPFKATPLYSKRLWALQEFEWNCAEQWMMAHKALLFDDYDILQQIQKSKNPKEQKALGREITGYVNSKWMAISRTVVTMGNLHKFQQNDDWLDKLLSTGDKHLVEGSGVDHIWGIGIWWDNPNIVDPANWRGTNWLGECLMTVRDVLRR